MLKQTIDTNAIGYEELTSVTSCEITEGSKRLCAVKKKRTSEGGLAGRVLLDGPKESLGKYQKECARAVEQKLRTDTGVSFLQWHMGAVRTQIEQAEHSNQMPF